jgi:hypothetical protein
MKIVFICLVCFLTGCSSTIQGWQFRMATEVCAKHGGVDSLFSFTGIYVTCLDGHRVKLVNDAKR